MRDHGVKKLVFSLVRDGVRHEQPRSLSARTIPTSATNPYGYTKVMIEQMLRDIAKADSELEHLHAAVFQSHLARMRAV